MLHPQSFKGPKQFKSYLESLKPFSREYVEATGLWSAWLAAPRKVSWKQFAAKGGAR